MLGVLIKRKSYFPSRVTQRQPQILNTPIREVIEPSKYVSKHPTKDTRLDHSRSNLYAAFAIHILVVVSPCRTRMLSVSDVTFAWRSLLLCSWTEVFRRMNLIGNLFLESGKNLLGLLLLK